VLKGVVEHKDVGVQAADNFQADAEAVSTYGNYQTRDGSGELQRLIPRFVYISEHLTAIGNDSKGTRLAAPIAS